MEPQPTDECDEECIAVALPIFTDDTMELCDPFPPLSLGETDNLAASAAPECPDLLSPVPEGGIVTVPDVGCPANAASVSDACDVCDVCAFEHSPAEAHLCTPPAAPLPSPPSIPVESSDALPVGAVTAVTDAVPFYIHRAGTSLFAPGKLSTDMCNSVVSCLVDTGAAITLVNFAVVQKLHAEHLLRPASELGVSALYTAGGGTLDMKGCL
eukprot:scpid76676/ scgid11434/ 